jgi:superfamily II DNA or RNA helicase
MNHTDLMEYIEKISEQINELREDGIENPDKILKHLRFSHTEISNEIKELIITKPLLLNACIKSIKKRVENYTNQYLYDDIIDRLRKKKISTSYNLDIIFKKSLEFMIEKSIVKSIYEENYVQIEKIEPEPQPDPNEIILKQTPRINQQEAYDLLKEKGLETGIHCQATGCGKTNIILHYIDYTIKKYGNNAKIILFTERVNILKDLFDFSKNDNTPNKYNILKWKQYGIANLENVDFINRVSIKKNDWMKNLVDSLKGTVLVINRAYLTTDINKYDMMKDKITLILHDECHNTSSERCNQFLLKAKEYNIPIIGFSATPLRTGKNDKDKLLEIYGDSNGYLKLLTNYNMIYAIQQKLILPPEFYWYHVELKKLNDYQTDEGKRQYELECMFEILNNIIPKLPNRKIVAWCGKIKASEMWKTLFELNHKQKEIIKDFKFYLDTSQNGDEDYEEFKKSDGNAILFCANKHREGSDIKKLDACMFLDAVIKRGCVPFIQSIGRVLRKESDKKVSGVVIDAIYKYDDYEKDFVDKIIGYYISLQNLSEEIDLDNPYENYDKYLELKNITKFDPDNEMIHLNFNNNVISINVNKLQWKDIIYKFNNVLQKKIRLSESNKLYADFKALKLIVKDNNIKSSFEYKKVYEKLKIIPNPEYIFSIYWKNWYDFLSIDTSIYPSTKLELKQKINVLNINTIKDYYTKADEYKIPLMPYELYPDFIDFNELFDISEVDTGIYITEKELNKLNLTYSEIIDCVIKNGEKIVSNKKKYRQIVIDIWLTMTPEKIMETTTFNTKLTNENGLSGYDWIPELEMSFQGKDANKTMKEIINMIKTNNYSIKISIKLKSENIINFRINQLQIPLYE